MATSYSQPSHPKDKDAPDRRDEQEEDDPQANDSARFTLSGQGSDGKRDDGSDPSREDNIGDEFDPGDAPSRGAHARSRDERTRKGKGGDDETSYGPGTTTKDIASNADRDTK